MVLIGATVPTGPTPHLFFDENNLRTLPSSSHQLELRPPLRHSIRDPPNHASPQPLTPQTTTFTKKKKQKRKGVATTSDVLHLMDALPFPVPIDIYTSLIKECTVSGDPETAIELYIHISKSGIKPPLPFLNRILIMFVACGLLEDARHMFDKMRVRDFNSWATLFVAYYDSAHYEEATDVFVNMLGQLGMLQFPPWILACLLRTCACTENVPFAMQVHGWLLKLGTCDHVVISSSLINFYGRFTSLEDASVVFNGVSRHNTLTWTAKIISGCRERDFYEVFADFKEMGMRGVKKDCYTFSSVLKACGKMLNQERCGEQVHADAIKLGLVSDHYVQCSLIAMYGRCGLLRDAERMFEITREERKIDCWNAMLMGYMQNGLYNEAVKFLYQMQAAGMQAREFLLEKLRVACGSITYSNMN